VEIVEDCYRDSLLTIIQGKILEGSIIHIQHKIENWHALENTPISREEHLRNVAMKYSNTLQEARAFLTYLARELLKSRGVHEQDPISSQSTRLFLLQQMSERVKQNILKLEKFQPQLDGLNTQSSEIMMKTTLTKTLPLLLEISFERSELKSFELLSHLKIKSRETIKSAEHYEKLIIRTIKIKNGISKLRAQLTQSSGIPESFYTDIQTVKKAALRLKLQAPYTLFWMRAVEIGLPLLLSIISIFFAARYPLTENRCYEIKLALKVRNIRGDTKRDP